MPRRVFITVAEVRGDHHAAELARALRQIDPTIIVEGHGGSAMRAAGVVVHRETVDRAVMLLKAVVRAVEIWKLLRWTKQLHSQSKPDLHVCIDSSGMNLHFAKMARSLGVPVLYYIAPQLWASREGRIKKVRRFVNRVACILPFEEEFYRQRGVVATFVGHPLFDGLPVGRRMAVKARTEDSGLRTEVENLSSSQSPVLSPQSFPVIGLMPGSRRGEVRANWPHMLEVADRIRAVFPEARFEVPTTPPTHALVCEMAAGRKEMRIEQGAIDAMAPGWDFCLAKSGTTTLHVAAYGVPMIVVYRFNPVLWHLLGRWIVKTPSIALVNILAERSAIDSGIPRRRIVPEIMPWHGSNAPVAEMAISFLRDPEKRREQQENLLKLVQTLDRCGASRRAAEIAIEMMDASAGDKETNTKGARPTS
jgi:lipid-A-disaccharide synthase